MRIVRSALILTTSLGLFATAADADRRGTQRPAWVQLTDGVRLAARDVTLDRARPMPAVGEAFYVFTKRALRRSEVERASQAGMRYLGVVTQNAYAFVRESKNIDNAQSDFMEAEFIRGTAAALPIDRVDTEVLPYLSGQDELPLPLSVTAWGSATAAEARALFPQASERRDLPTNPDEMIMEERFFHLDKEASTIAMLTELTRSPLVASIRFRHPPRAYNAAARAMSNGDQVNAAPYNLDGSGVVVGHWDGGSVSSSHQDFGGRVTNYENSGANGHATHTAGTILGSGAGDDDARGFAPGATMVAYTFYGDPAGERRQAKHEHYHEHDNHSWGSTSSNYGAYSAEEWDLDCRDLFLLGIKAAGNEGASSQVVVQNYGFDSLPPDSTAKNLLVVGATSDDGDLTGFSSRGPTNDGRIKPDLSANGQNLRSTMPSGRYGSMSGTSMSTPATTGMVTLIAQLYKQEYGGQRLTPEMTRAIMIHTVTDVFHRGPDYRHGWGNADVQSAANLILADVAAPGTRLVRGAVRESEVVEYEMDVAAGSAEARVTLSWLDAYADSSAQRRLINDIDLELVSPSGTTFYPWTLDGGNPFDDAVQTKRNSLDNVEQVLVENPESGVWIVRISGFSVPDPRLNIQGYVLATSHSVARAFEQIRPNMNGGMTIPDGDPAGLVVDFNVTDTRIVKSLRVYVELKIRNRGNIEINLVHPDGTRTNLEKSDTSTRRDIYALYPDTRSYDEDVVSFYGRPGTGVWKLEIIDNTSGQVGTLIDAGLEIDFDGPPPPPPNTPPAANAGEDQTVNAGELVRLNGTASSDPDGDALSFLWQQQSGPGASLTSPNTADPSFTAPAVKETTSMIFRLNVDDGNGGMASDDVTITVIGEKPEGSNRPPIARVGEGFAVGPGYVVNLDASTSEDPDGDPLAFLWTQSTGDDVEIMTADTAFASFTSPDVTEPLELTFQVEVTDDSDAVDLATITITVEPGAPPPPTFRVPAQGLVTGSCVCVDAPTDFGAVLLAVFALAIVRRRR